MIRTGIGGLYLIDVPIGSMYAIYIYVFILYICLFFPVPTFTIKNQPDVAKYTIHASYVYMYLYTYIYIYMYPNIIPLLSVCMAEAPLIPSRFISIDFQRVLPMWPVNSDVEFPTKRLLKSDPSACA